jgi:outer membrane protein assembly factor BamB
MKMHLVLDRCRKTTLPIATLLVAAGSAIGQVDVTTYHNDSMRTGWNKQETDLIPAKVNSSSFGLMKVVSLDDQVDAQPLFVSKVMISGAMHDVVYVATENNTIYAIDASTGSVLLHRHLVPPVHMPLGCGNNGPNVGINGTPTIDVRAHAIYVMVYTQTDKGPAYKLYALDLSKLTDARSPMEVTATQNLKGGGIYRFKAEWQRQRPALLDANGNIYAAFGSFCDFEGGKDHIDSRGWLLGWKKTTLAKLNNSNLNNRMRTAPANVDCFPPHDDQPCFLSSIWMSGYGPAADPNTGDLYFTTGNTASTTYDKKFNFSESVVRLPGDLALPPLDLFTPSDVDHLDARDEDFGSGGAMVLPDQPGEFPHLAVAAGKDGRLFVLNRDKLGGRSQSTDFPNNVQIGRCHCGPSYFDGSSGARVVSSGGNKVQIWSLTTENSKPSLALVASGSLTSGPPTSIQDPGFFTSVSSNGTTADTAIIWAVDRPVSSADKHVTLYAFKARPTGTTLSLLWKGPAGLWCHTGGNANIVPTVANGRVYVASERQLEIFGFTKEPVKDSSQCPIAVADSPQFWGIVTSIDGDTMVLELRNGRSLQVDIGQAVKDGRVSPLQPGQPALVKGSMGSNNVFNANIVLRAKGRELWEDDREK